MNSISVKIPDAVSVNDLIVRLIYKLSCTGVVQISRL